MKFSDIRKINQDDNLNFSKKLVNYFQGDLKIKELYLDSVIEMNVSRNSET
jgi:hypothetical protein